MSRNTLLLAWLLSAFLLPALPLTAQEVPEDEETVEVLEFLEEKDEGNLAVDPASMKTEAYELYKEAHFFFKNIEKRRSFWGKTASGAGHVHDVALDGWGNGVTSEVDGHSHEVKGGIVQEAAGSGSITAAKHTHEMRAVTDPRAAGNLKRRHFFHVLGITEGGGTAATQGAKPHRHVVACYLKGARGAATTQSHGHRHVVRNFKVGKAVVMKGRRQTPFKDAHTHTIKWIAKQYFSYDGVRYLSDLFEQAARKHKNFAQAYYYRCICQQTNHEFDLAKKNADKAIRGIPDFHEAIVERGDVFMWLGNFAKAHADYKRAMDIAPDYAHANFMDAMCYLREANFVAAEKAFATAVEKGRKEAIAKLDVIRAKGKEHLDAEKQEALAAWMKALLEGELKGMGKAQKNALEALKGKDRPWVDKCASICSEYNGARSWAGELEKEKTFPGWGGYEQSGTDHYTVKSKPGEMTPKLVEYFAGQMESAYKLYRMRFKKQVALKIPTNVFIYATHKSYVQDGAPPQSGGYQHPYFNKIVVPISRKDYREKGFSLESTPTADNLINTQLVLFHEAFHKYLNKFLQRAPQVFNEGCAEYFGPSKFNVKRVGKGWSGELIVRVNPWRIGNIKQMIQQDVHLPFEPFWKETKGEMYNRNYQGMNYAQAWAWVFFLFERTSADKSWEEMPEGKKPKRKYFNLLGDYYKAICKGKGLNRAWDASFGRMRGSKLTAFDQEWREFINRLK